MADRLVTRSIAGRLRSGDAAVGVWGVGRIGVSTVAHFGYEGVRTVGYDPDERRVGAVTDPDESAGEVEDWLQFDLAPVVADDAVDVTTDVDRVLAPDVDAHLVAVPTEKDGDPWNEPLEDVMDAILDADHLDGDDPTLIVVESTLTPGTTDDVVLSRVRDSPFDLGDDVQVAVAPRRDWFVSSEMNLRTLPRVYGGATDDATDAAGRVLGLVCENLVEASDHRHAEAVKSVENAYRHVGIALANQLDRAYPDLDVREVLAHAGTKWNVPTYHPSVGTGGYCIPVASEYVLAGAADESELTMLREAIRTDESQPRLVADVVDGPAVDSVAILGLAYRGDLPIDALSPAVDVADELVRRGIDVRVHDPYFEDDHVESRTGGTATSFPSGLAAVDAVLLLADHSAYDVPTSRLLPYLRDCEFVLDNLGAWQDRDLADHGVAYAHVGDSGWMA